MAARTKSSKPKIGARVVPDRSIWTQYQRIGGSLTPLQVSAILQEANGGQMTRLMDLANDARQKDGTLQAVLSQSEESIAGLDWQLELPTKPKAKEKRAAEWCDAYLRGNAPFARLIAHLAGAVYYGYSVAETVWGKESGRLVPAHFECLAPRRFGYRKTDSRFVLRDDFTASGDGVDIIGENPFKFVVSRPRVTGDVPCREGLARVLMWAALFRNWDMTDWLRTAELSWKPWRIGKYKPGTNAESIANLEAVLERMSTNGYGAIPDTTSLQVEFPPGAGSKTTHAELFETLGREMTKAVLGQTETTQASTSSGFAQAKVHNEIRKDLRESRARTIAADITRDVIEPMFTLNFGEGTRTPRLRFVTDDSMDFMAFSTGVKNLVEAGTRIPSAWVRDEAGIPEPKAGEEIVGVNEATDGEQEDQQGPGKEEGDDASPEDGAGDEP